MLSLRIAVRFLRKSPLQSGLIALGIAVGIGVQVFVGSLITSLQTALVDETIGSAPQVTVSGQDGFPVTYSAELRDAITSTQGVDDVVPVRSFSAIFTRRGESAPLSLTGGRTQELDTVYDLSSRVVQGSAELAGDGLVVGLDFADTYALGPGDRVPVLLPTGRPAKLVVTGVVDLGSAAANERTGFVSAAFAAEALRLTPDQFTSVVTQLDDPFDAADIAAAWRDEPAFADLEVSDWQADNQDLLDALQAQSSSSYLIQVFVLIAVALGIASTLAISAVQKTRQIGILKAMGLPDGRAARVFVWQALIIGACGAALGVIAGIGLIGLFNLASGDRQGSFPIDPQPAFVVISFAVGVLVALLSAVVPSRRTSRLDPIEVIQSA
jgi:lipoprotein-releasing system permease protein